MIAALTVWTSNDHKNLNTFRIIIEVLLFDNSLYKSKTVGYHMDNSRSFTSKDFCELLVVVLLDKS